MDLDSDEAHQQPQFLLIMYFQKVEVPVRALSLLLILTVSCTGCVIPKCQYSRTVSQSVETEPLNLIDLTTFNGSVSVETHELPIVDMEITYKGYGISEEAAQENCELLDCEIEANDGMLTVKAIKPSDHWTGSASFKLKVPADCALKLQTSNGKVSVGDHLSNVEARTSNGTIELRRIQGDLIAKTSNGTIHVEDSIGRVNLTTSNGKVYYAGFLQGSENEIHTSNGRVYLKLPANSLTEVAARTSNGSINCDLPTQRVLDEGKRRFHAIVGEGDIDKNDAKMTVRTSNGSIKIEPWKQVIEEEIDITESEVVEGDIVL